MEPQAYISFDVDHNQAEHAAFIEGTTRPEVHLTVKGGSAADGIGGPEREKLAQGKIGACDLMIVLVGETSASSQETEIRLAKAANVPFFGIYVGPADEHTELPAGLARNRILPWDWTSVAKAVEQLMKEGKHHVFV
jgi:hypothetical protein